MFFDAHIRLNMCTLLNLLILHDRCILLDLDTLLDLHFLDNLSKFLIFHVPRDASLFTFSVPAYFSEWTNERFFWWKLWFIVGRASLANFSMSNEQAVKIHFEFVRNRGIQKLVGSFSRCKIRHPAFHLRDSEYMRVHWKLLSSKTEKKNTTDGFGSKTFEFAELFFAVSS